MRKAFFISYGLLGIIIGALGFFVSEILYSLFIVYLPLGLLAIYESVQKHHTIMKNFPLFGRLRYVMEALRPKIYQYFIESDTDGTPVNRIHRSVVYQRAKKALSTTPFGTQLNMYAEGYEWINHSMSPLDYDEVKPENLRVTVGGRDCKQPYSASILNISAMSYGSLSSNAILALNKGANTENFAHNTGEGSISQHHLNGGGSLIWQIGTGYFGCRTKDGKFSEENFKEKANIENVKMIEIKLSQGAKPGHGGILPAKKNTPEIAKIRGVEPYTRVVSPAKHSAFNGPRELLKFVQKLRELSNGKPIGFKLCVGRPDEIDELCKIMAETQIFPDFITIDGGEGGTGAAPLEFSNSIGMSLVDGLVTMTDALHKYGIRQELKIFASGKLITGFHIIKALSLGADACYCARAMMLALGCIQALECNKNTCPAGIATTDPNFAAGLDPDAKAKRIANFHHQTIEAVAEILAACGKHKTSELKRSDIWRRTSPTKIESFEQIYPLPKKVAFKESA
ncbi:MAG: FMN-binding glutamate synthase family protein [Bacteriovoracaceae bacterium]